jgi:N-carbamoylputrescine amidase
LGNDPRVKSAVILQHTPTEGRSGRHVARARAASAARRCRCTPARPCPTTSAAIELLIVMGGPMGVGDAGSPQYPFLAPEIALLRELLARDAPVLGICLGRSCSPPRRARASTRTRARARRRAGARARGRLGPDRSASARPRAGAGRLPAQPLVVHWHGDTYDLPPGAVHLASTPVCRHQAYRIGRAFGLQFHPELERETIATWVREDADYVHGALGPRAARASSADTDRNYAGAQPIWDRLARQHPVAHAIVGAPWRLPPLSRSVLVQMRCSPESRRQPGARDRSRRQGPPAAARRSSACPSCSAAVLLPGRGSRELRSRGADSRDGQRTPLALTARQTKVVIIASLFERRAAGIYHNTAVIIDATASCLGSYARCTSRTIRSTTRSSTSRPGDLGFRAFDTVVRAHRHAGVLGPMVSRGGAADRARRPLTCCSTRPRSAGHPSEKAEFGAGQASAWQTAQRAARDRERRLRRGGVNRVGHEQLASVGGDGLEFWGGSFVADPFGVVVAEASRDKEETLIVTCDRTHQETVRRHWPFLRDRRIDAYGAITRRFIDE